MEFNRPEILETLAVDFAPLDQGEALARAEARLRETRDYGRTLWTQLDRARRYLLDEVAGGENGEHLPLLTNTPAWRSWADLFGGVSSALAGKAGDHGVGRSEATLIARTHGVELSFPR